MTKSALNQNANYAKELIDTIEPDFVFSNKPINRFKNVNKKETVNNPDKNKRLLDLKNNINSIENCIGEAPSEAEEKSGLPFQGEVGSLLDKMFLAINIKRNKIYSTYTVNFRTPEDRKPTSQEIKRYSIFLKEHISIINPKIVMLMGSTAMEAITGSNDKISSERGEWKEIILKNVTFPIMITLSPSYLIRFPENKKYSWEDLKKVRQKIQELNIKI